MESGCGGLGFVDGLHIRDAVVTPRWEEAVACLAHEEEVVVVVEEEDFTRLRLSYGSVPGAQRLG